MTDRDNVIRAVDSCFDYWLDKNRYLHPLELENVRQIKAEALALLKEQEAVKPKSKSRHGEYPQIVHRCGNCNEILYRHYKHCPTCGRAVKWE